MSIASEITRIRGLRKNIATKMTSLEIPNVANTSNLQTVYNAINAVSNSTVGSATANTTATAALSLNPGYQTTISAGYYKSARIIRAAAAGSGNVTAASGFTLAITDKTNAVTVGTLTSGNYPINANGGLTGVMTASTPGWFSSSDSVTDSTVKVGMMAAAALGTPTFSISAGTASISATGITTSTSVGTGYNANYYISLTTTAGSATSTVSVSTAGYAPTSLSKTSAAQSVSVTADTAKLYIPVLAATTYTASTSDQTIAANKYIIGTQTIKGVSLTGLTADKILAGNTINITSNGNTITSMTGTMTNNGAVTASLNCGQTYTVPAGYHNGAGVITANSLASQTPGTATALDILSGQTAWVNGNQLTGLLTVSNFYVTDTPPTDSLGQDGDFCFVIE